jgi:hypothetical protein
MNETETEHNDSTGFQPIEIDYTTIEAHIEEHASSADARHRAEELAKEVEGHYQSMAEHLQSEHELTIDGDKAYLGDTYSYGTIAEEAIDAADIDWEDGDNNAIRNALKKAVHEHTNSSWLDAINPDQVQFVFEASQ